MLTFIGVLSVLAYVLAALSYFRFHKWACPVEWTKSEFAYCLMSAGIWPIMFPIIALLVVEHLDGGQAMRRKAERS